MKISILKNGAFNKGKNAVLAKNTTVVDAIFHIIFCYLIDNPNQKECVTKNTNIDPNLKKFIQLYYQKGTIQQTLTARTTYLKKLFKVVTYNEMNEMDCSCSIDAILPKIVSSFFLESATIETTACSCPPSESEILPFLDIDVKFNQSTQQIFELQPLEKNCAACSKLKQTWIELNNIVFINKPQNNETFLWKSIPKILLLQGKIYLIFGIIQRIVKKENTHYVSHVMRPDYKWYVFNNANEEVILTKIARTKFDACLLVFTEQDKIDNRFAAQLYPKVKNSSKTTQYKILQNFHMNPKDNVNIVNVCGPDCFFHMFICFYNDSPGLFQKCKNKLVEMLNAYKNNDMSLVYDFRKQILNHFFQSNTSTDGTMQINCLSNVYTVLGLLNCFHSIIWTCTFCKTELYGNIVDINIEDLPKHKLTNLSKCIYQSNRTCNQCKKRIENMVYDDIIFFDVQLITRNSTRIGNQDEYYLNTIESHMILDGNIYQLKALIESHDGPTQHYTVHCQQKNDEWLEFDDLVKNVRKTTRKVLPHMLVYIRMNSNSLMTTS